MKQSLKKTQHGVETVEFMIVFGIFMMLIITIFDFGRALFFWNALTESTRRAARMAAVCPNEAASHAIIQNVAVFNAFSVSGNSPVIKNLSPSNISLQYFDVNGNALAPNTVDFEYVTASITGFTFQFIIPFLNNTAFNVPTFQTTKYRESRGAIPNLPGTPLQNTSCNF